MTMKSTVTRAAVAAVAGLAIVADAFLLFVKPHLQQSGSGTASLAAGQPLGSTGASGNAGGADGADTNAGQSGSGASSESGTASGSDSGTSAGSEASSDASSDTTTSTSGMKDGTYTDGTYTSVASPNQYGEVQLQVTVKDGRITTVTALTYPNHTQRSQSISAQAIPELSDRAVAAQSSSIQYVSGATETSTAFVNSLQDAINQALNAGK